VGYDLHISRDECWAESSREPITRAEWRHLVDADPAMEMPGFIEATNPADGAVIRIEDAGIAVWSGHPAGVRVPFSYRAGRIIVKSPDSVVIDKMLEIASVLGAHLIGDEGERYPLDLGAPAPEGTRRKQSWWRRPLG
jgi:hypothetical protein